MMYRKCASPIITFAFFFLVLAPAKLSDGFQTEIDLTEEQSNESLETSEFSLRNENYINPHAHEVQGDIKGVSGHMVQDSDGTSHFEVDLWPNGVIPYTIIGVGNHGMIRSVMNFLEKNTCLRFKPRRAEKNYIEIRIVNENECDSIVGMQTKGKMQDIQLNKKRCMNFESIGHEIMHAIGFIHEQSRPDRNKYVTFHPENLKNPKEASEYDIEKDEYMNLGVPYDLDSIVHYNRFSGSIDGVKPTLVAKNGRTDFGDAKNFSKSDLLEINRAYKCKNGRSAWGRK